MADRFDRLVAGTDPAMAIVTTAVDGERGGCLVGFHSQTSIEPPRYAVWLSKANHTHRLALRSSTIAVHLLGEDDLELARLFGTLSGDVVDKFRRCETVDGPGGVPLLVACPNRIVGRRITLMDDGGDHVCLVIDPTEAVLDDERAPLRLSDVVHLRPAHEADERPGPPTERAGGA